MIKPSPSSIRPHWLSRVAPWFVSACVLIPNVYVVIGGRESFPFTSAPMFAHYVGEDVPLFLFEFRGIEPNGKTVALDPGLCGRAEPQVIRMFFSKFYGSTRERSPFGDHAGDTREKLEARLQQFFAAFHASIARREEIPELSTLALHLVRVDRDRTPLEARRLGVYDVATQTYTHVWPEQ